MAKLFGAWWLLAVLVNLASVALGLLPRRRRASTDAEPLPPSGNPKLDNLRRAWRWVRHELIVTCDVNIRFRPDELRRLAGQLTPQVGLLTAVPIATEPRGFCGELETAF